MKNINSICELRDKIQNLVDAHPEELQDIFGSCDNTEDSAQIKKEYDEKVNPDRKLHVGIVGRVKAGKSSLLNSLLFNGKDVLPKAATPMTAALTKLYYSEKLTVKINFFVQDDVDELKKKSAEYDKIFDAKFKEIYDKQIEVAVKKNNGNPLSENEQKELKEKSEKMASNKLREEKLILSGAAEQYRMIQNASSEVMAHLGKPITFEPSSMLEIGSQLADYVGANGKFTAITSNVEIGFPNETLKEITVVDTPGFDDPVPSRDTLARESLKVCDAIFVLSPSSNFCNDQDKSNISKIEKGEGIQEVYIVASRIDDDLGNESMTDDGDIQKELSGIVKNISGTLNAMLDSMIRSGDTTSDLAERLRKTAGENLLYTSGMCQSLYETWDEKDSWQDEKMDVWSRLMDTYPDSFGSEDDSAREILKQIGNIDKIKSKIKEVSERKNEILQKRENDFLEAKYNCVTDIIDTLHKQMKAQTEDVENSDVGMLEKAQKVQEENLENLKEEFEDSFESAVQDFVVETKEKLKSIVTAAYSESKGAVNGAIKDIVKQYTEEVQDGYDVEHRRVEKKGFFNGVARALGLGGYDYKEVRIPRYRTEVVSKNVHTVNAHAVCSSIEDFAKSVSDILHDCSLMRRSVLKKSLKSMMLDVWAKYNAADYCSGASRTAQAGQIVNSLPEATFEIDWKLPSDIQRSGTLENERANAFEDRADEIIRELKQNYTDAINEYCNDLRSKMQPSDMAETVLSKMKKNIEDLKNKVANKKETLYKFDQIKKEIESLRSELEM